MNEQDWMCRTELLVGKEGLVKLKNAHVLVAGLGGVGGYAAEQLCRAGIGKLTLVDNDTVHDSNKNRQIIALDSTLNKHKTEAFINRFKDINPDVKINTKEFFILDESARELFSSDTYDYAIDAIDTLTPKVDLIEACLKSNTPLVSSMGSGGRIDPLQVQIAEVEDSHHCKFAHIVRKHLHRRNIYKGFKVVFSPEPVPDQAYVSTDGADYKRTVVGTISYMPAIFGCFIASIVIRQLVSQ